MHAPFGQVPGVHLGGMPLGVHLGMPPQLTGRPPFFERPFPVVRLRGLPFNAGELDVMEFFQARPWRRPTHAQAAMCVGHWAQGKKAPRLAAANKAGVPSRRQQRPAWRAGTAAVWPAR